MVFIDPVEQEAWDNRRRRATDLYQVNKAQLAFKRSNAQQDQSLETNTLARRFDRMREQLPGSFARRGLLNSGLYGLALQRYGTERQSAFANLAARYQQMLGQLGIDEQLAGVNYTNAIGDINDQERVRRAQIAAALRGIV